MAYAPTSWVDGTTPVNATNLNKIETELGVLDGRPVIPAPLVEGNWLKVQGGVMVWSPPASSTIIDAKGDLIAGQTNDTPVRLAVGTDGQVLTADTASTLGMKWAAAAAGTGYGTSFPGSPTSGQLFVLVDSTTNPSFQWTFRYNAASSSAFKWEFIGGTAAIVETATSEALAATTGAYIDAPTVGPSFTLPNAGDYQIEVSAYLLSTSSGATVSVAYAIAATAAIDADAADVISAGTNRGGVGIKTTRKNSLTAGSAVVAKYKQSAGTATIAKRVLRIWPIRCS